MKVAKNKLVKLALKDTKAEGVINLLKGPTFWPIRRIRSPQPRVAVKYAKENDKLVILGGAMGASVLDANAVKASLSCLRWTN